MREKSLSGYKKKLYDNIKKEIHRTLIIVHIYSIFTF